MIKVNGINVLFSRYPNGETMMLDSLWRGGGTSHVVEFKYETDEDLIAAVNRIVDEVNSCAPLDTPFRPGEFVDPMEHYAISDTIYSCPECDHDF